MGQTARVTLRIDAENRATREIQGFKQQMKSAANEIRTSFGAQLAGALSLGAVAFSLKSVAQAAAELQASLIGLASVTQAFGGNAREAQLAAQALARDGLMTVADAATGLKNLIAAGFGLPEAITLMERFKDSAAFGRQSALSFGQAVVSATEGIKNGNSILVDNAGVTKNLSVMLTEAGHSAQDLMHASTDAGVRMAIFNGIVKETAPMLGNTALFAKSAAGEMARTAAETEKAKQALGLSLQPAMLAISRVINSVLVPTIRGLIAAAETVGIAFGGVAHAGAELVMRLGIMGMKIRRVLAELAADAMAILRDAPIVGWLLGFGDVGDRSEGFFREIASNTETAIKDAESKLLGFKTLAIHTAGAIGDAWRNAFSPFAPTVDVPAGGTRPATPPRTPKGPKAKKGKAGMVGTTGRGDVGITIDGQFMPLAGVDPSLNQRGLGMDVASKIYSSKIGEFDGFEIKGSKKLTEELTAMPTLFDQAIKKSTEFEQALTEALTGRLVDVFVSFGESLANAFQGIDGAFKGLLGSITSLLGDMMITAGTQIVATSSAYKSFRDGLTKLFPEKGIAAGIALIAAGAALKAGTAAFLSNPTGGGAGGGGFGPAGQFSGAASRGEAVIVLDGSWKAVVQDPDAMDAFTKLLRDIGDRDVTVRYA